MKLLSDDALEKAHVVANCRMNRERNLTGSNGYSEEIGINPVEFIRERVSSHRRAAWLDLRCGTGKSLIQAAKVIQDDGLAEKIEIVGVDLVGMFHSPFQDKSCLHLVEASLSSWSPTGSFDLITCVHGLHYTLLHALGVHALGPGRPGWTTTQVYPARSPPDRRQPQALGIEPGH